MCKGDDPTGAILQAIEDAEAKDATEAKAMDDIADNMGSVCVHGENEDMVMKVVREQLDTMILAEQQQA
jgi:hypothetical protein